MAEAEKLQVRSTPTFFFGNVTADGKVRVTNRLSGAMPLSAFTTVIDSLVKAVKAEEVGRQQTADGREEDR
jgi:protein-disulfide isomerase